MLKVGFDRVVIMRSQAHRNHADQLRGWRYATRNEPSNRRHAIRWSSPDLQIFTSVQAAGLVHYETAQHAAELRSFPGSVFASLVECTDQRLLSVKLDQVSSARHGGYGVGTGI